MNMNPQEISKQFIQPSDWPHDSPYHLDNMIGPPKPAAVLVPLLRKDNAWHILYIRRTTSRHDRHSGQVAFPGGRRDPDDESFIAAALRETHEEVGIRPQHIQLLGSLNSYHTISNFRVIPIVGHIPWPYSLTLSEREVARAFTIPLTWLMNEQNYALRHSDPQGNKRPHGAVYYEHYDGELLWGATARMTLSFIQALDQGHIPLPSHTD